MGQSIALKPAPMTSRRAGSAALAREVLADPGPDLQELVDHLRDTTGVVLAAVCIEHAGAFHYLVCGGMEPFSNSSEQAICTLAITQEKFFEIPDLSLDKRTARMAVVDGSQMALRYYASSPLYAPDGELVGRLCLFDSAPRTLSPSHRALMSVLTAHVATVLDLRLRDQAHAPIVEVTEAAVQAATGRMAHELRTPLATMAGGLQMLDQMMSESKEGVPADAGQVERIMRLVNRSATRMTELVDSMLRLSHSKPPVLEAVDLSKVMTQVAHDLASQTAETGAVIDHEGLGPVPGDAGQLRVVMQNLVGNALKYGRNGTPLRIEVRSRRDGDGWRVEVEDNGVGIPPERRDDVFAMFERQPGGSGFGIGLSTVAQIVHSHGGSVGITEPDSGQGTLAWFRLPDVKVPAGH